MDSADLNDLGQVMGVRTHLDDLLSEALASSLVPVEQAAAIAAMVSSGAIDEAARLEKRLGGAA